MGSNDHRVSLANRQLRDEIEARQRELIITTLRCLYKQMRNYLLTIPQLC